MADARERIERRYPTGNVIVTSADRGPYTFSIDILPSKEKKCPEIDEEMAKFDYTSYELAVGAMSQQIVETLAKKPDAIYIDTFLYCRDQTHCRYSFALLY